jgi:hypothetical protein
VVCHMAVGRPRTMRNERNRVAFCIRPLASATSSDTDLVTRTMRNERNRVACCKGLRLYVLESSLYGNHVADRISGLSPAKVFASALVTSV